MDKETIKALDTLSIKQIIEERVGTNLGQIHGTKCGLGEYADVTTTVDTILVSKAIVEAGYGDVKQAVRAFAERLKNKIIEDTAYGCNSRQHTGYYDYTIKIGDIPDYIDELVKEVCGE